MTNPKETQVGGDHYKKLAIQPMEYSMRNGLDPMQHTAIKYVTRFRDKDGLKDLEKARHCLDMLIENDYGETEDPPYDPYAHADGSRECRPLEDGWQNWYGGIKEPTDINENDRIDIKLRYGAYSYNGKPSWFMWSHIGRLDDIIAYRKTTP